MQIFQYQSQCTNKKGVGGRQYRVYFESCGSDARKRAIILHVGLAYYYNKWGWLTLLYFILQFCLHLSLLHNVESNHWMYPSSVLNRYINFCIYWESICILRRFLKTHRLFILPDLLLNSDHIEISVMRSPWFDWEAFMPRAFGQAVQISDLEAWVGMNLLLLLVHWLIWPSSLLLNRSKQARICKTNSDICLLCHLGRTLF